MKVAIIGGGQLARMLALSGIPLGLQFSFLLDAKDRQETRCIDGLGDTALLEDRCDWKRVFEALGEPDVITVEKEQVEPEVLQGLSAFCPVYPRPDAFAVCSFRQRQKQLLQRLNIPTAPFRFLAAGANLPDDIECLHFPLFAKSTNNAYDGRNQFLLPTLQDLQDFWQKHSQENWIVEEYIQFEREVSLLAVRSVTGEMGFYSAVQNYHHNGILIYSISPAPGISDAQHQTMIDYARGMMAELDYVGVLAVEYFVAEDQLIVNEIAPRVHNSGHWTSSGAVTCQFENHLRAIAGLPLGVTDNIGYSAMVNLLGVQSPPLELLRSRSSLNWYNKSSRPGRKVGHINLHNACPESLERDVNSLIQEIRKIQEPAWEKTA